MKHMSSFVAVKAPEGLRWPGFTYVSNRRKTRLAVCGAARWWFFGRGSSVGFHTGVPFSQ